MDVFWTITTIIIILILCFIAYRLIAVKKQHKRLQQEQFENIKVLYEKLESGDTLTAAEVYPFAASAITREITFKLLIDNDKTELFPTQFYNFISAAETNLVNWLKFPTELDAYPDKIEYIKRVTFDFDGQHNFVHYEVFRYCTNEPHWAAKDGWTIGVVGPYFDDSKPYDFPASTFSRIGNTANKNTPEEEAKWVNENISLRQ